LIGAEDRRIVFIAVFDDVLVYIFEIFTNEEPNSSVSVRTRHLLWPSLLTEILQTTLLVRQKDLVHTSLLTILEPVTNSTHKVFTATDERLIDN
jgi:hypothetical protein